MDDFVAALLCLSFIILPSVVLLAIILSKIRAFLGTKLTACPPFSSKESEAHSRSSFLGANARYCENCHVSEIVPDDHVITPDNGGVRAHALDPTAAEAFWKKSEELVGEKFSGL